MRESISRFPSSDVFEVMEIHLKEGRSKIIYKHRDGKSPCAFRTGKPDPGYGETDHIITRTGGKVRKQRKLVLKGPSDIVRRKNVRVVMHGKKISYRFLTAFENDLLTRRVLGQGWKSLARRYSGGHRSLSFKASRIKNLLSKIYRKIRIYDRVFKNVPAHINIEGTTNHARY